MCAYLLFVLTSTILHKAVEDKLRVAFVVITSGRSIRVTGSAIWCTCYNKTHNYLEQVSIWTLCWPLHRYG